MSNYLLKYERYSLCSNIIFFQVVKNVEQICKILDIKGLARIDFFYDKQYKNIYLNEINTLPGFTEISMFPKLIMNEGLTYKEIISKLNQFALVSQVASILWTKKMA